MPVLGDAFDIEQASIVTMGPDGVVKHGFVSGVTVDGRRPEEFVNVIGGQIRRRKPEETDFTVDAVVLYNNLQTLKDLRDIKFDIEIEMVEPRDPNGGTTRKGQKLTIVGCRIADESITVSESSTFRFSGRADSWKIAPIGAFQTGADLMA